jgi:hypothetical protein
MHREAGDGSSGQWVGRRGQRRVTAAAERGAAALPSSPSRGFVSDGLHLRAPSDLAGKADADGLRPGAVVEHQPHTDLRTGKRTSEQNKPAAV